MSSTTDTPDSTPADYTLHLRQKCATAQALFTSLDMPAPAMFPSPCSAYRMRAEFEIKHQGEQLHYAMHVPGSSKQLSLVNAFPAGSTAMQALMPSLLPLLAANEILRRKLYRIDFLTTTQDEVLVSLVYHKPIDDSLLPLLQQVQQASGASSIVARSKGRQVVAGLPYVTETLTVNDEAWHYRQYDCTFTQPNARINEQMLGWAQRATRDAGGDLLELYCGNGNFTLPLSRNFHQVLATEITKLSLQAAHENLLLNNISNVQFGRVSSEEFTQAWQRVRPFRRLAHVNLDTLDFSTVLVDPPRAGLDAATLALVQQFPQILYISCNPQTLAENLTVLCNTHAVKQFAFFDQFPWTPHLECGVWLKRINVHA